MFKLKTNCIGCSKLREVYIIEEYDIGGAFHLRSPICISCFNYLTDLYGKDKINSYLKKILESNKSHFDNGLKDH